MSEKWRSSPSVLTARRLTARDILIRRRRSFYASGEPIKPNVEQPSMDSILELSKGAVEDVPHIS